MSEQDALIRAGADYALAAIRGLILINGAAAIALLAFLGDAATNSGLPPDKLRIFGDAMILFGWGAFLGALTAGFSYLAQILFTEKPSWIWCGNVMRFVAISTAIGGFALFLVALEKAAQALT